jgi:endonuclease-3
VNSVTPALFARYPTAKDFAEADPKELQALIKPTGFYKNKAKLIQRCCQAIIERFGGEVPGTLDALVTLPGVGRKTANVVLNVAFGAKTIAIDTHAFRVANRTGLAPGKTPLQVEETLNQIVPNRYKHSAHHWLILHGRYVCKARKPECWRCLIADICLFKPKTLAPKTPAPD